MSIHLTADPSGPPLASRRDRGSGNPFERRRDRGPTLDKLAWRCARSLVDGRATDGRSRSL